MRLTPVEKACILEVRRVPEPLRWTYTPGLAVYFGASRCAHLMAVLRRWERLLARRNPS